MTRHPVFSVRRVLAALFWLALLAPAVRRPIETVRPVLGDLVLNGLLITSRVHGELVYQLRPDPQMQATVRRFSRR